MRQYHVKIILLFMICIFTNVEMLSQNTGASAKSDSLYVIELYDDAVLNSYLDNYTEAVRLLNEAVEIHKRVFKKKHPYYATTLISLAIVNSSLENYKEAIRLESEALEIIKTELGKDNHLYASSLSNLAVYNSCLKNYKEAIRLESEAREIIEIVSGKKHPDYATSLSRLVSYNSFLGNYKEVVRWLTEEIKIKEGGKNNDPNYATLLNRLAMYHSHLGNYKEAFRIGSEALKLAEITLGKESRDYASMLNNLALYNMYMGNYEESIRIGSEALKLVITLGKESQDYAVTLSNYAMCISELGNYSEAIRLESEALEIIERVSGKKNPDYATSLANLATHNSNLGNYSEAIRLVSEVLSIQEKTITKNHPKYAMSLNSLALYNYYLGNYAEAIHLGLETLEIREKVLGKEHPDYAISLNNLALYNSDMGNYAESVRLGSEALSTQEIAIGKDHPSYALTLHNIAIYNTYLGNYEEATRLCSETMKIREKVLGKEHPDYIAALKDFCVLKAFFGDIETDGLEHLIGDINNSISNHVRNQFAGLTSYERNSFWNRNKTWFERDMNNYSYYFPTERIISDAYDASLLSKGLLLNCDIELSQLLLDSGDEGVLDTYNELQATRLMLEKLYEKPIAERDMNTDSLERKAKEIERELVLRSKTFGDYTRNMAIKWTDVKKRLKPKDIAMEFVSFPIANDGLIYAAYILTSEMTTPRMINLFESKQLKKINPADYYHTRDLSSLVWGKMDDYLKGVENIYFSPSGELYNISIESLPDYNGDGLISDRFNVYRLSSTRELAVVKDKNKIENAALYGGMKYDTDVKLLEEDAIKHPQRRQRGFSLNSLVDSLEIRSGVSELPDTKVEVENINRSLKQKAIAPKLYTDYESTEGAFKDLNGAKTNIIHIATHGFYYSESEVRRIGRLPFISRNTEKSPRLMEDRAMTRSGLLFTGANNALSGKNIPENVDDGILTAKEIAGLDLRGLDLVVLSACQTGLGEITGDGVFGLQRGFKNAGANTLLMSLWKVDDRATQMLMTKFYEHFLSGKRKYESLILAQKYVREYEEGNAPVTKPEAKDKTKPFADPKYWAAFILLDALD